MRQTVYVTSVMLGVAVLLAAQSRIQESSPNNLPVQKIGANDLLALSVYGAPELTRTVRVSAEGWIRLPMLKAPVKADGRLPVELETEIAARLEKDQILVDPIVTVTIVEYFSRPISVAGAVKKPTSFQAVGPVSLLDAVARAEGLNPDAGSEILVTRRQPGPDGEALSLVQRVPVRGLIDAADPDLNILLHGGEEVRVPEAGRVFVVGNVKKPGAYAVQDASETTVLKLLALSEGLVPFASNQAFVYRREATSGSKNEIRLELNKILQRKAPDVPLLANDILYVPDNRGKRIGLTALDKIISFGSATASGVLVWGAAR